MLSFATFVQFSKILSLSDNRIFVRELNQISLEFHVQKPRFYCILKCNIVYALLTSINRCTYFDNYVREYQCLAYYFQTVRI